jgi:archaeal type IV pilus assembly protein PilA
MAFTKNNEEAVSPVIGVILMVAITVILAAVIAAFVFGMAGNISKTKVVAATVQQPDAQHITVTFQGGQDAGSFQYGNVTIDATVATWQNSTGSASSVLPANVGGFVTANGASGAFAGKDHVIVVGYFTDGSQQVILDNYI